MSTIAQLGALTGGYVVDAARTRIGFVARHTMSTRVRGHFTEYEGGATLNGEEPERFSARMTLRAASLTTGNPQRDELLHASFLDAEHHPSLDFASTGIRRVDDTHYKVSGDLTIRGTTRRIVLDAELGDAGVDLTGDPADAHGDFRVRLKGGVTVNRNDWEVNWNSVTSVLVAPKVRLEFDVTLIRLS
ncbi:polyisoprenoid-binding protein [Streptomyces spiroverticillatus]|uniref:Polyisoprenoid-binding protein n=1 Tax=Streptomyces finlayi TaxID=67296 RepID=A0A918X252_9ACTN|nr:YceI family protein [Streptomyces finlayi]GHA23629.1 polyisoprenoid-binding protein [Streptomyces spiroverticillatus]GHD04868.1 polyisoprenoid-binding protein [Streptomyces finlayi]